MHGIVQAIHTKPQNPKANSYIYSTYPVRWNHAQLVMKLRNYISIHLVSPQRNTNVTHRLILCTLHRRLKIKSLNKFQMSPEKPKLH